MRLPRVRLTVGRLMLVVALGGLMLGGYERLTRAGRYDARCQSNLRAIGVALAAYQADHGSLPPAFVVGADDKPTHSWRALLLPYLDEPALARAYRFDEPWNGPNNRRLIDQVPDVYRCPAHDRAGCSSYSVIVGSGTVWPGSVGTTPPQILDFEAIVAVELEGGVPWLEPRDLQVGPFVRGPDPQQNRAWANRDLADLRRQGLAISRFHPRGMNWLMTPLSVVGRRYGENQGELLEAQLSIAGREAYCIEEL